MIMGVGGMDLNDPSTESILIKYAPSLKFTDILKECGQAKHCLTRRESKHIFLAESYAKAKYCVKQLLYEWQIHPLPAPPPPKKKPNPYKRKPFISRWAKPKPPPPQNKTIPPVKIPVSVRNAMIDLTFALKGDCSALRSFGEMLSYIRRGQWKKAMHELSSTEWCKTPENYQRCNTNKKCIASAK